MQLRAKRPDEYALLGKRRYPERTAWRDLALGELPEWAIEVERARVRRDNGDYADTAVKEILSR